MSLLLSKTKFLDRYAIGLSGLCLVHCLATSVALAMLASVGGLLGAHWIHELGLSLAMMLGAIALGRGIFLHGFMMPSAVGALGLGVMAGALRMPHNGSEALYTMLGVGVLALGHELNRIAAD
ncbi:MAG: MerC domain-containing protein [Pseudomonadota bacterium]|nr:MerC domain-containing protein [Pseudomonadota bacterium]